MLYTHVLDSDPSAVPTISPAIITKVHPELSGVTNGVDLKVFHSLGDFAKLEVQYNPLPERGTWHWPPKVEDETGGGQ